MLFWLSYQHQHSHHFNGWCTQLLDLYAAFHQAITWHQLSDLSIALIKQRIEFKLYLLVHLTINRRHILDGKYFWPLAEVVNGHQHVPVCTWSWDELASYTKWQLSPGSQRQWNRMNRARRWSDWLPGVGTQSCTNCSRFSIDATRWLLNTWLSFERCQDDLRVPVPCVSIEEAMEWQHNSRATDNDRRGLVIALPVSRKTVVTEPEFHAWLLATPDARIASPSGRHGRLS